MYTLARMRLVFKTLPSRLREDNAPGTTSKFARLPFDEDANVIKGVTRATADEWVLQQALQGGNYGFELQVSVKTRKMSQANRRDRSDACILVLQKA